VPVVELMMVSSLALFLERNESKIPVSDKATLTLLRGTREEQDFAEVLRIGTCVSAVELIVGFCTLGSK